MKFGICSSVENAALIKKIGYDYIELALSKIGSLSDEEFADAKKTLETVGLSAPRFNLLFPKTIHVIGKDVDSAEIQNWLDKAFKRMQELGGKTIVFGSGKSRNLPSDVDFAIGFEQLVKVTKQVGQTAAKYGITVVIEPLNRSETNMINSVTEGAMLAYCVAEKNVGVLADWYHMAVENESPEHINMVGKILHAHIAAKEKRLYPLGTGDEFKPFFGALKAINYDGMLSVEGKTENMEKDAVESLALLKKLEKEGEIK